MQAHARPFRNFPSRWNGCAPAPHAGWTSGGEVNDLPSRPTCQACRPFGAPPRDARPAHLGPSPSVHRPTRLTRPLAGAGSQASPPGRRASSERGAGARDILSKPACRCMHGRSEPMQLRTHARCRKHSSTRTYVSRRWMFINGRKTSIRSPRSVHLRLEAKWIRRGRLSDFKAAAAEKAEAPEERTVSHDAGGRVGVCGWPGRCVEDTQTNIRK